MKPTRSEKIKKFAGAAARFVFIAGGVFILGAGFLRSVESGVFRVSKIEIEIEPSLDPKDIQATKARQSLFDHFRPDLQNQIKDFDGFNIWSTDVESIAKQTLKNQWVDDVNVQRRIPNLVRVRVTPKTVSALYLSDKTKSQPIAVDGSLLPEMPIEKSPDVPILRQQEFIQKSVLRKKALAILHQLPKDGNMSQTGISEISLDRQNSFWLSLVKKDIQVRIGENNVALRAARVERVLNYLENNNLQARVIDADFSKKVIVKPRKAR